MLATAGGDGTVRLWEMATATPCASLLGHTDWVQALAWAPGGGYLVSGSREGAVGVWGDGGGSGGPQGGKLCGRGHGGYVTGASWEPLHRTGTGRGRFVTSSKDGTVRVWRVSEAHRGELEGVLSGHSACVTCVRWGGGGLVYSSSHDRTLMVWDVESRTVVHTLRGHGHWVNNFALNTELVLRSGAFDHTKKVFGGKLEASEYAKTRYEEVLRTSGGQEKLVSCSDDHTLFLWTPGDSAKPVARMTGHQDLIYSVRFSPDGSTIASASQDKSIKLWRARDGHYMCSLRNHVGAVYHVAWSLDSRFLVSASKDSTIKLWDPSRGRMIEDLPGHADEVYAVDWSPDGLRVASGSKDTSVRIWRH